MGGYVQSDHGDDPRDRIRRKQPLVTDEDGDADNRKDAQRIAEQIRRSSRLPHDVTFGCSKVARKQFSPPQAAKRPPALNQMPVTRPLLRGPPLNKPVANVFGSTRKSICSLVPQFWLSLEFLPRLSFQLLLLLWVDPLLLDEPLPPGPLEVPLL